MSPTQVTINGRAYTIGRIDTLTQLELARRYSQALIWTSRAKAAAPAGQATSEAMAKVMLVVSTPIEQADVNYVVNKCLSVTSKIEADRPMPLTEVATGRLMYADTPMADIMQIVYLVLDTHGLVDFFADPPQASPA